MTIAENLTRVRERIAAAEARAGRAHGSVKLMAVSKTFPASAIREAYGAGQRLFGENRVQEFAAKRDQLAGLSDVDIHLIGHLQSNKAVKAAEIFHAVDSVDSLRLAEKLNAAAARLGRRLPFLLEVNVGGEEQKSGLRSQNEIWNILSALPRLPQLELRGLMTVPPVTPHPEGARPYFRQLRELAGRIRQANYPHVQMDELSMGMSHDFEIAIAEGSTCVRLGTAIFGARAEP